METQRTESVMNMRQSREINDESAMDQIAEVPARAKQAKSKSEPQNGDWIDRTIWTERMLAALGNGVKGNKWYSLIDKVYRTSTLEAAWQQVKSKQGAAGIDQQSIERFSAHAPRYIDELATALEAGHYQPDAVRRVEIPKADGKTRPLGIPTVKDRIVQTAVKRVIEPIFEQEFMPSSYGFRPGRSAKDALREVDALLKEGHVYVVDADLKSYFDTIPHPQLNALIEQHISDSRLLALLAGWMQQEIVKGLQRWTPTGGTPQGAVISPLLANIYLHPLDKLLHQQGYRMVRYADDFVILCQSEQQATAALAEVNAWVETVGLSLHPDKTHIGDCRQEGQGFEFLGYRFEAGKRWVRDKSLRGFKDKIRIKTNRSRGDSLALIISELSPIIRGWYGYFKHANYRQFAPLDGFIRRRLRALLRKQEKRPGNGRCREDHKRWPNAYFAGLGLFTMTKVRTQASQSR